ncbi:MAG: nuclear transport factor 2 family protein [Novosphingobium sp.]|nr:nuclear transport factor 2 family protein [Novosphingobium sp.]
MGETADNKRLVREYLQRCEDGDIARVAEMLAPDLEWWVAGSFPGAGLVPRDVLMGSLGRIGGSLVEPLRFEIECMTAEGDRVAVAARARARRKDGSVYEQAYHMLFFIRDGVIVAGRPYLDTLAFAEQVHGAIVAYPENGKDRE